MRSIDNHLADTATETYDRELDYTLEENSEHVLAEIDAALKRIEDGTYGICTNRGEQIPRRAPGGHAVGDAVHRLPARTGASVTERSSERLPDVRVGSATDGLTPISVAERPLGAEPGTSG